MTLARLIEAVERGEWPGQINGIAREVFPYNGDWRKDHGVMAHEAFDGSLDAAMRLHDALLPDHRMILDFVLMEATIFRPCHDDAGERTDEWDMVGDEVKAPDGNMARAMLLAILRCLALLRAMEGRDG